MYLVRGRIHCVTKYAFSNTNLSKQVSDGCSGEKIDCIMQFIPPGSRKNGILQLEATQDTFPSEASHGGLYCSPWRPAESFGDQGLSP